MSKESSLFNKVQLTRSYEEVARQIQQAITDQRLKPGEKLPSQRELMDMFQVSKFTIMGALRLLEQWGLVYTKYGATGGTFVSESNTVAFSESLKLLVSMRRVTLEELAELRLTIEGRAAYWAAKRRRPEDIKKMELILDKMGRLLALNRPMEEMIPLDMSFHLVIGEASHNGLFLAIMEAINACFLEKAFSFIPQGKQEEDYGDLRNVLEAIRAGDARLARKIVRQHIARFNKLIVRTFSEKHPGNDTLLEVPARGL
ncbi:MAG: FCD domain-containing protein [Proteobacteria bacterium]|nr:FCD domain-containing protein [Pseudomonadota bacterium]NIS70664.1 FCD domain-containing protein [Pseudomonadota bacterium]